MAQTIAITTAQNVTLDYHLANLGDRILAFILDTLIKVGYCLLLLLVLSPTFSNESSILTSVLAFVFFLPVMLYSLLFETFSSGQTPGKMAMKIRVVHLEGGETSFSSYFLRWLFRIVDILIMSGIVGILAIALSEKGQRVGDALANTTVISLKKKGSIKSASYEKIPHNYTPRFPNAAILNSGDITTIKEVLALRGEEAFQLKKLLSQKIESVLKITKEGSSDDFLRQVVRDFNYYEQAEL